MSYDNIMSKNVYWIGVNDRETELFENLWPIPKGISYNSYLITDEKNVLIDTVKVNYQEEYLDKIMKLTDGKPIDYLVVNHMEPDHSGSIKELLRIFPDLTIIGNSKTTNFLKGFYNIESEKIKEVTDKEIINIGENNLTFYITPMLHWPETMMTYINNKKILFSGDVFGSFAAFNNSIFDDELDIDYYDDEIIRYFSNIVGKYSPIAVKHINNLKNIDINIIASTHGPIWRNNPEYIINKYLKMSQFKGEKGAIVVYGTMYGNTKKFAEEVAAGLTENGVKKVKIYDVSKTHKSYLISDIWNYSAAALISCSYNNELFPPMLSLVEALENRGIKNKYIGLIGTYSWSGGSLSRLKEFIDNYNIDLIEPIIKNQYAPTKENLNKAYELGKNIAREINKEV